MAKNQLIGAAGEYAVCWQLSLRGWIAIPLLQNAQGIDVLATKDAMTRRIQVKTQAHGRDREWMLTKACEDPGCVDFYILVTMSDWAPEFHIVPATVVAKQIAESHQEWLSKPGRGGRAHQDNDMRRFKDYEAAYLDKWSLLDAGSNVA